ncbi:MAG: TRAP transporter small permease [Deltaproteobacteria bacterium]|nr:TRAP transporter small permease [Deltaproteobacteria bacterium]MBW2138620.1 TRAP transporter small permease [Deltaproteobacteria bacterium]
MDILEKISNFLNRLLIWIAGVFLAAMILLSCANIFLRIVWMPIRGTYELLGYFGAIVTAFALGYTQQKKGHIAVDILVLGFSRKKRQVLDCVNSALCMVFFGMVAWQISKYATTLFQTGEVTETLRIIYYPFTYGVAFGCCVLSLVFLAEFLKSLIGEKGAER